MALDAAAERAKLRGGGDVAFAAYERARRADRRPAAAARCGSSRAGDLAFAARPSERGRAAAAGGAAARPPCCRARDRLVPPGAGREHVVGLGHDPRLRPHRARAGGRRRRPASPRSARHGLRARLLGTPGRPDATRDRRDLGRDRRAGRRPGPPARRSGSSTRSAGASRSSSRSRGCPRSACPTRTSCSPSASRRRPSGPTRSRFPSSRRRPRALARDGRLNLLAHTLVFEAWADLHRGAVRRAITSAAEGARIAEETRALRYVLAARLAQAIASAEQGEDETAERLIADAEALLMPLGANPMLALTALARGRLALAGERFGEAYEHLVRIFDPAGAAFHPFVRGWALADLADAAVRGDGDLDAGSRLPRRVGADRGGDDRAASAGPARVRGGDPGQGRGRGTAFPGRDRGGAGGVAVLRRARAARLRSLAAAAAADDAVARSASRGGARRSTLSACCATRSGPAGSCGPRARRSASRNPGAWSELSPQELQIAQLAAEGLSNRRDRRAALSLAPDRRVAPLPALPEARRHLARTATRRARKRARAPDMQ